MGDAVGKLFLIVRDHDERLVRTLAELTDNLTDKTAIAVVEPMQGFVEDEEFGVFDESPGQEAEALLTAAEAKERCVGHLFDAEDMHPSQAGSSPLWTRTDIESDGVTQSAGYHVDGWNVFKVCSMHFGADVTDVSLYLPDALARATTPPEELDVAGVGLRIVGTDQAEQSAFAGAVSATQGPSLAFANGPVEGA